MAYPRFFLTLALASSGFLSACSNPIDDIKGWFNGNDSSVSEYDYYDGGFSAAMDTLKVYVTYVNDANSTVNYVDSDVQYLDGDIQDGYTPYFYCNYDMYDEDATRDLLRNPVGLTDAEAADLVSRAEEIFPVLDRIEENCGELAKNITAEDYLDDDYASTYALIDALYADMDSYYDFHNELMDAIDVLYEIYDTFEVDPNDPYSVSVGNISDDLDLAEAILDFVEAGYMDETWGETADLQALYNELSASVDAHTGDNAPALDTYSVYYYDYFYDSLNLNYLPVAKRSIRNIQNNDQDAVSSDYSDLLYYYNILVDDYNYHLDTIGY